jgi:hypothetical protein
MKKKIALWCLAGLGLFLLGFSEGRSRTDRLVVVFHDFFALYEKSVDVKTLSVNERIRFREIRTEIDRLYREAR